LKNVAKLLLYCMLFLSIVIALTPKTNLYYLLETYLQKQKVVLSNEQVKDMLLFLNITEGELYYEDIAAGKVENIDFIPLVFFNRISIKNVTVENDLSKFLPKHIDELKITYSILNPTAIQIEGHGEFGVVSGDVKLLEKKLSLELNATDSMRGGYGGITSKMKFKDGVYTYEYIF